MKKLVCLLFLTQMYVANIFAQAGNVGIATVTPNSKLQVDGSIALGYRVISASSALTVDDYAVEFTGVTADSITLPNATACSGRVYVIKNTSPTVRAVARIVPIMGQMIDGRAETYLIYGHNDAVTLTSNGSDWLVSGSLKVVTGSPADGYVLVSDSVGQPHWSSASAAHLNGLDPGTAAGNTTFWDGATWVSDNNNIYNAGTTVGIGTSTFNPTNPEKLLVDAGYTSSVNAIVGKGSINSYLQLNIQNTSAGTSASSDVVATADNGDETTNYVDMGINGSANTSGVMGSANDAYMYNMGENMLLGTGTAGKSLMFLTGGVDQTSNERMRIDGSGNVGIGTTSPTNKLDVNGALGLGESGSTNGSVVLSNSTNSNKVTINSGTTSSSYSMTLPDAQGAASSVLTNDGSGNLAWGPTTSTAWGLTGNAGTNFSTNFIGTTDANSLRFRTDNTERFVIDSVGNARFGTATTVPNTTNPEKFLVDAGSTSSVNAIVGKGTINSYFQLNIQNFSNGTSASSDVVATADNGDETNNYIDMGINGSGNSNNVMGQPNDAYIFNVGQDLLIGATTPSKSVQFLVGGTDESTDEVMRVDGSGNVGVHTTTPTYPLDVNGAIRTGKSATTDGSVVYSNASNARTVTMKSGITSASYDMTLPVAQGAAGTVLSNDGSGVLSWVAPDSGPTGATGADGATGPAGADGATGANGATGADGATGLTGATGATGATGETGATGVDGGNAGKLFYLDYTDASDIGGYKVALASPSTNSESNLSQSNSGTTDNLVATFATPAGEPGVTALPYGISELNLYAATNNAARFARLKLEIYKRTAGGAETLVTSGYSSSFSNTTTAKITWTITEAYAYSMSTTDRLVFKLYTARVSGTSPVTVNVYFEGSSNASYLQTTISAGAVGPEGPVGADGATGATGAVGATGAAGPTGATGAAGANGDRYATTSATSFNIPSAAGSATFTVATGLSYSVGQSIVVASTATPTDLFHGSVTSYNSGTGSMTVLCASATGSGNTYSSWTANLDGTVGAAGATGATGAAGSNGTNGATGATGAAGSNGTNGATGATGAAGSNGTNGATGAAGSNGTNGATGATGPTGAAGSNGSNGAAGATGATGSAGATGADGSTNAWGKTGTSGTSSTTNFIGTTDSRSFRVRTNNVQRMVVDSLGRVAIGSTSTALDASNPEKFLVDAGTTTSVNAIAAVGTINDYFQMNIQNLSSGSAASTDIVATANNGNETTNYIDMGINGSGNSTATMGGPDDSYIYNVGGDMYMGSGTAGQSYIFMTGGTDPVTNERMRIDGSGNIGIGNASPSYKLDVNGTIGIGKSSTTNGVLVFKNNSNSNTLTINSGTTSTSYSLTLPTAQGAANSILTNNGSGVLSWGSSTGTSWGLTGNSGTAYATNFIGTTDSKSLRFRTNNTERFVIDSLGNVRVGSSTTTLDATHPQKFLVDAGTTTSQIAAAAKGSINNNLQLGIQNTSNGTAASSNFVATADNGTISTNLLNMGINGSGNTSAVYGSAGDAHIYNLGQDLLIGTGTAAKSIHFLTGGTSEASNERMIIDGSGNIGMGTATPGSKLDLKGTMRFSGSTSGYVGFVAAAAAGGTTYTLPSADGASGQALTTNGSGTLAWGSVASPTLLVAATRTSTYTLGTSYSTLAYNSATTNVGSAYNTSTGVFTAPATGLYQIIINNNYTFGNGQNDGFSAKIVVNSATDMETYLSNAPYSSPTVNGALVMTDIVSMVSGQTAYLQIGNLVNTCTPMVSTGQHMIRIIRLN